MKYIAFYLPQYHEIEENNQWWGKGFTDWVNVKKARRFFAEHRQPRIPLNSYYYDLSKAEDISRQAKIAKQYGIDGFCIYHYWFNGKLLLEKPVEIIREHKEIDIEYCFSWANETWARTWDGKNHDYLLKQTYGEADEWKAHFDYFIPYFKDDRYIKIDNKPMLVLYKVNNIPNLVKMMKYWNEMAMSYGFSGMHYVCTLRDKNVMENAAFDAYVEFEPARALSNQPEWRLWWDRVRRYSVSAINSLFNKTYLCNSIKKFSYVADISSSLNSPKNTYGGLFLGWDNSPRKGTMATIIMDPTADEFEKYLDGKIDKVKDNNNESNQFIFINAWNEWAEGTYLEPDMDNEYKYLEIIKKHK